MLLVSLLRIVESQMDWMGLASSSFFSRGGELTGSANLYYQFRRTFRHQYRQSGRRCCSRWYVLLH
jgi:hypothetical protein